MAPGERLTPGLLEGNTAAAQTGRSTFGWQIFSKAVSSIRDEVSGRGVAQQSQVASLVARWDTTLVVIVRSPFFSRWSRAGNRMTLDKASMPACMGSRGCQAC